MQSTPSPEGAPISALLIIPPAAMSAPPSFPG